MVTSVIPQTSSVRVRVGAGARLRQLAGFPVLLAVLLACIVFLMLPKSVVDPDIGWHLRNAEFLFEHHGFLRSDLYSFTTLGKPWVNPEWLAEVPFWLGYRLLGERGLFLVELLAMEAILLGVFALAYRRSKSCRAAFAVSFAAIFLASVSFGPRTLLFGWLCLVGELWILLDYGSRESRSDSAVWLLPVLFLAWINLHGSWIIGLVLLGMYIVAGLVEGEWGLVRARRWSHRQLRQLACAGALSVAGLFINPYGWRLVANPFDMAFRQKLNIANVQEWGSVDFHSPRGKIVLAMFCGAILLQLVRRRSWPLDELAFLLLGLYSALTYSRFLFLAAILILPLLARDLAGWAPDRPERDRPLLNAGIIAGLLITMACMFPSERAIQARWSKAYPRSALPFLSRFQPSGNVFTSYEWGGYLILHDHRLPVFMDSRMDIFEHNGVLADYLDAARLKNTFAIFDKYSIKDVLFPADAPLSYLLLHAPGWKVRYQDRTTILFERTPATAPVSSGE